MFKGVPNSYKDPYWSNVSAAAEKKYGLPPGLLQNILTKGERSNADQVSPVGAKTPFQIMENTRKLFQKKYGIDAYSSPQAAAAVAALHLKESADRNNGDWDIAVTEYIGGPDRSKWGKTTREYTKRVTGSQIQAARQRLGIPDQPRKSTRRQEIADTLAGKNGADAKAALEDDIRSGRVIVPAELQPKAGSGSGGEIARQSSVDAYNSGRMSLDDMADFEQAVASGIVSLPKGASLQRPKRPGIIASAIEAVTGNERATPETEAAQDYAAMPELNSLSTDSFKAALGTMAGSPDEMAQVIKSNFPNAQVSQDEKGNYLLRSSMDGQTYAIKPGFQLSDIPRAIGNIAAFSPAGAARTIGGAALGSAATQAGIEAAQAATGGNFDVGEVALAGALGGAVPAAANAVRAATPAARNLAQRIIPARAPEPAAEAIEGAIRGVDNGQGGRLVPNVPEGGAQVRQPAMAGATAADNAPIPAVSVVDEVVTPTPAGGIVADVAEEVVVPPSPVGRAAETAGMGLEELAETATKASRPIGGRAATSRVAAEAAPNPEVLEAAERLGVAEYLQPDHVTTSQAFRELSQAAKSVPGSTARAAEMEGLQQIGQRADELLARMGAESDVSSLSSNLKEFMSRDIDRLMAQEEKLFGDVRAAIPKDTPAPATQTAGFVKGNLRDFGGEEQLLSPLEKRILSTLDKKDGAPTYAAIDRIRKDVGEAIGKRAGPFKDESDHLLGQLYGHLIDDIGQVADAAGVGDILKRAKGVTVARKGIEDDMKSLFGKALDQSVSGKLGTATQALAKGDAEKFAKLIAAVPKEQREKFALSALRSTFGKMTKNGELNFNTFANWFRGLRENKQSYAATMSNIPPASRKQLEDLYTLSDSIAKATRENITTGRVMAAQQAINGTDGVMSAVMDRVQNVAVGAPIEAISTAAGMPGLGLAGAVGSALTKQKTTALQKADALIASPEFKDLAIKIAKGEATPEVERKFIDTEPFKQFARATFMPHDKSAKEQWLSAAILGTNSAYEEESE